MDVSVYVSRCVSTLDNWIAILILSHFIVKENVNTKYMFSLVFACITVLSHIKFTYLFCCTYKM